MVDACHISTAGKDALHANMEIITSPKVSHVLSVISLKFANRAVCSGTLPEYRKAPIFVFGESAKQANKTTASHTDNFVHIYKKIWIYLLSDKVSHNYRYYDISSQLHLTASATQVPFWYQILVRIGLQQLMLVILGDLEDQFVGWLMHVTFQLQVRMLSMPTWRSSLHQKFPMYCLSSA